MRDSLKSKEYFDNFISEDSKRIASFEDNLANGKVASARIGRIKEKVFLLKLGVFIAKYSRGDDVLLLNKEFESLFDTWANTFNVNYYDANLKMLSLCILFNFEKKLDVVKAKLNNVEDWLFYYILIGENNFKLVYPAHYEKLQAVLKQNDTSMLTDYVKNSWFDEELECFFSHKSTENLYYGYWCFEVAAIIKKMKIDDSELKDIQFYPYDLVHFE